jgi:hypothetical protein
MDAYPKRAQPTGLVEVCIRLVGAGAAAPTVAMGPKGEPAVSTDSTGVTSGRTGVGVYTLTFGEKPGKFVGWHWSHGHTTPTATTPRIVQIDPDSFDTTDLVLNYITITPATDAAAAAAYELTTADTVCLYLLFKQTGKGL